MEIARLKLDIDTEEIMRSLFDCSEYWQSRSDRVSVFIPWVSQLTSTERLTHTTKIQRWLNDILLGHFSGLYESGNTCITRRVRRTYRVST
jgi:hypothetical protein